MVRSQYHRVGVGALLFVAAIDYRIGRWLDLSETGEGWQPLAQVDVG